MIDSDKKAKFWKEDIKQKIKQNVHDCHLYCPCWTLKRASLVWFRRLCWIVILISPKRYYNSEHSNKSYSCMVIFVFYFREILEMELGRHSYKYRSFNICVFPTDVLKSQLLFEPVLLFGNKSFAGVNKMWSYQMGLDPTSNNSHLYINTLWEIDTENSTMWK